MTSGRTVAHVTCLGCGCACDDITVVVERDRIASLVNACPLGQTWFGDGTVPEESRVKGRAGSLQRALTEATKLLTGAKRPLIYVAADVSCEAQREAVAIADRLRAALDTWAGQARLGACSQRSGAGARGRRWARFASGPT